jgi:hypothetical protein
VASVFLSYARSEMDFARQLGDVLAHHGHDVWGDWKDIPPAADWSEAISAAIDGADAFLAVLTPEYYASAQCASEADRALNGAKRIIPVLRREGYAPEGPFNALASIPFSESDDSEAATQALLEALKTDPDWAREHRRLLEQALEWERSGRDSSYLLRGRALTRAETWLARGSVKLSPTPSRLQSEYVVASRRRRKLGGPRRRRRKSIFVSYRREDTLASAGRLYDWLSGLVGEERVFMDVASIRPGVDFVAALEEALDDTGALLAVIGVRWLDTYQPDGRRRLDNPTDFVRLEVEGALARGITVIPVLVDGAQMPRPEDLPPALMELVRRQSFELSHAQWKRDVEELVTAIPSAVLRNRRPFGPRRR